MTAPAQITDHVAQGLGEILSRYDDSPLLRRVATIMLTRVQELEDLLWAYYQQQFLDTAVGVHLDRLGRRVGQLRGPFGDADYRRLISARVIANNSDGNVETLLSIVDTVMSPHLSATAPNIRYFQHGRAYYRLEYDVDTTPSDDLHTILVELLAIATPGGVGFSLIEVVDSASPFRYDLGPGYDTGVYARVIGQI